MQKRIILFVLLAALIVPVLYAADTDTSMNKKKLTEVNGTIDQIDLKTMTLTIKVQSTGSGEPELKVFTFDSKTSFEKENAGKSETIKSEDFKVGDNVKVQADSSSLAVKVHLESPSGATQDQPEQKQE